MKYNVFTDFHHASLLNSLIMLFEGRLGGNVYRPIGMEWAEQGFWKVYDHPATQQQFLGIGGATPDGTPPLNQVVPWELGVEKSGYYLCHDIDSGLQNKAITFETFLMTPIDIVIASLPQHIEPFKRLCEAHPNKPKFIYQIGNAWDIPSDQSVLNVMASAEIPLIPAGVNFVSYHQEFDTKVFAPGIPQYTNDPEFIGFPNEFPRNNIFSFVNVFQDFPDYELFENVERLMLSWNFKSYGGQCRDGAAHGSYELAKKMQQARFIWHTKAGGDGYGHIIHNAAAVARPMITKSSYYSGKLGEKLMIDGETCINIDGLSLPEIVDKIVYYSEPERYKKMCERVYENFKRIVDFDKEAEELTFFMQNLK